MVMLQAKKGGKGGTEADLEAEVLETLHQAHAIYVSLIDAGQLNVEVL